MAIGVPAGDTVRATLTLLVALVFCLVAAGARAADLTNDDVIKMSKSGLSEQIILQVIESTPGKFDTSPAALIALKEAGVPEKIIARMVQAGTRREPAPKAAGPAQAAPALAQCANDTLTDVVLIQGHRRTIMREDEGVIRTDNRSVLGEIVTSLGMVTETVIMTFGRSRAEVRLADRRPTFEVNQPEERNPKVPLTILRLTDLGPARKLEAVKAKNRPVVWNDQSILPEHRLEWISETGSVCRMKGSSASVVPVRSRPAKPLAPGEYAVVRDSTVMFTFGMD